jgi:hypothetical protein
MISSPITVGVWWVVMEAVEPEMVRQCRAILSDRGHDFFGEDLHLL